MSVRSVRRPQLSGTAETLSRRHKPDYILVILSCLLLVVGLVVIYAISPGLAVQKHVSDNYFASKQLIAVGLGVVSFLAVANLPLGVWRKIQTPLIISAAAAAVIVRVFGERVNGAYRWIQIGGLSFQAVELVKFALMIWLAGFLADRAKQGTLGDFKETIRPLAIVLGLLGLMVAGVQSDLGSTAVLVAMMACMSFVVGLPMKKIALIGGIILIGGVLAISTSSYRRDRLFTFMHPERDCQNAGYQACQALIAVGSGGVFGKGLAHSVQAYGYLPEAANDSIFAIYAEKFGFLGVAVLLTLFGLFFARLKSIMTRAPNTYTRLIMVGVLAWLSTQAIINLGAMLGLLPLKGITLPFISYGGTSVVFVTAAIGLAFNISRYTTFLAEDTNERGEGYARTAYRRGDRRPYYATGHRRP